MSEQTETTNAFNVTPAEYAKAFGVSQKTARETFLIMLSKGNPNVCRTGKPTVLFEQGKLLRMSREYFLTITRTKAN